MELGRLKRFLLILTAFIVIAAAAYTLYFLEVSRFVFPFRDETSYAEPQYEREASQVSLDYPASPEHLLIELDYKQILIRRMAFYDPRPQFNESLVIIMLHHRKGGSDRPPPFYIQMFYNGTNKTATCQPLLNNWKKIEFGYGIESKDHYAAYLLRAELNNYNNSHIKQPPSFAVISRDKSCSDRLPVLPVYKDMRENKTDVFSVCTAKGLFGNIDPQWLMHWIEFNKALGATYITILIDSINNELYNAIRPYQEEGLVEIIDWQHHGISLQEHGMMASAQECIYRNINRAEYLNLHDSDEILVPQKHTSWKEMIQDLKSITDITKYASFSFPNAYWYDVGLPIKSAEEMLCDGMKLPEYFKRTNRSTSPEYVHPKDMIVLDLLKSSDGIHHINDWRDGKEKEFRVPTNIGQSFHFRTPLREQDYKRHTRAYDAKFMLPFVKPIMTNLRKRLC